MIYRIVHRTEYLYDEPASLCYNEARLLPRAVDSPQLSQICRSREIVIEPPYTDYRERTDYFGNNVIYFTIRRPHTRMIITAASEVDIEPKSGSAPLEESSAARTPWETLRAQMMASDRPAVRKARQFVIDSPMIPLSEELTAFAAPAFPADRPVLDAARALMERIHAECDFVPGVTSVATPLTEVLETRRGVCQDFAHLMVGCLRAQGLAARYVSGYIETLPPPGEEKLQGADASHAWCSLFVPALGWVDFDPTNNLLPGDQHIVLGWGRDFADVTPLKGVFFSTGEHKLEVSVDVTRLA